MNAENENQEPDPKLCIQAFAELQVAIADLTKRVEELEAIMLRQLYTELILSQDDDEVVS